MAGFSTTKFAYNLPAGWGYSAGGAAQYNYRGGVTYYSAVPFTSGQGSVSSVSSGSSTSSSVTITPGRFGRRLAFFATRGGTFIAT